MQSFQIAPTPLSVSVEQKMAAFHCQNLFAIGINWMVNRTPLNVLHPPSISAYDEHNVDGTVHVLSVKTLLKYNGTVIECVATFNNSQTAFTTPVVLLVQGLLITHSIYS